MTPTGMEQPERDRLLAQLAGAVAHKLKQPLAVAWGYLELLADDSRVELDPHTLAYITEIRAALRDIDDFVNRLQRARTFPTRQYAGGLEILDFDDPPQ